MKYLVLLGDGMADFPIPELDGRTPLEAAKTPAMDEIARLGICALFKPIPDDLPAGSDIGNLTMFGYNPHETFTGRAPLEAARQGVLLKPGEVAFRCNLVTLEDGRMRSFTSGHITTEEAAAIIPSLNRAFENYPILLHPGVSYRHLGVVQSGDLSLADLTAAKCEPPHNITDQEYAPYLPSGAAGAFLREIMEQSQSILADHPVSRARVNRGDLAPTSVWLWGQGVSPRMQSFRDRFGISGAVVSAVDLVNGIGVCAGLEVLEVPGATGYLDTNYEGKVSAALSAFDRVDFVYLHIEATDETSHEGKLDLKLRALEDFDSRVVAPCLDYALKRGDVRVLVAPDHITALSTKTHAGGPVPFALCGPGVVPNGARVYSEPEGAKAGVLFPEGHELVPAMIQSAIVDAAILATSPARTSH
ncbi:MAG: cofactor-independent phosphoglycerate mutase [Candidatus Hydrogenedentes bacterium]|nr:cofactor-independent phosphoglycerate mutase [Candidatus Hydrogenedentota bacterium]